MVRTSWANADDDGTLDVNNNNEALIARPRQASETGIVGSSGPPAKLSKRSRPLPAQPESTQPSKKPSSLLAKSEPPPSSEQESTWVKKTLRVLYPHVVQSGNFVNAMPNEYMI